LDPNDQEPFRLDVDDEPEITDPRLDALPAAPTKPKTAEELQAELDKVSRDAALYAVERDTARLALERAPVVTAPAAPAAPVVDEAASREQYQAYLRGISKKQLEGDYEGAAQDIFAFNQAMVKAELAKAQAPAATGNARQAIRNFVAQAKDDPLFPHVKDDFEQRVNQAMPGIAAMPIDMQDQAVEAIYEISAGKYAMKQARNGRREDPPPYATGSVSSGQRPASRQKALNAVQKQYVLSARDAGIPEDRIRKALDEMEAEGRA
jgi:hypothetical protein